MICWKPIGLSIEKILPRYLNHASEVKYSKKVTISFKFNYHAFKQKKIPRQIILVMI